MAEPHGESLTLEELPPKSNGKVSVAPSSVYWEMRSRVLPPLLREGSSRDNQPPERLLQLIWQYQRVHRDQLRLLDGRSIRVLHPGFWNVESGPDFRNAIIQISAEAPLAGDVEIDVGPEGWRGHGHLFNPAYDSVRLHVIWAGKPLEDWTGPTLALETFLDAPLHELNQWLSRDSLGLPESVPGQCLAPLRGLSRERVADLLRQAAEVRLHRKGYLIRARARQAGWEQAFWETVLGALGYKHNVWPMRRLAELIPQITSNGVERSELLVQARFLGAGNLLPHDLARTRAAGYLKRVWDLWWREREQFSEVILPRELWRLHGLRPANQPHRRLALAAHWLCRKDLLGALEGWVIADQTEREMARSLLNVLQLDRDEFWSWHWTLRSRGLKRAQPLLGAQRLTDLAINAVLPWFWIRAVSGKNEVLQRRIEERYWLWPAAEDNAVLRLARRRLFGEAAPPLRTAAFQQGLLQIVRDFCNRSNALCENCPFPDLVRGIA